MRKYPQEVKNSSFLNLGILSHSFCNSCALLYEQSSLYEGVGTVIQWQWCVDTTFKFSGNVWVVGSLSLCDLTAVSTNDS